MTTLILGKRTTNGGTKYMLASESVALTALGYEITRDITIAILNQTFGVFHFEFLC
jgi:glutamine phosphoribosylpyrophosphate amidotransferase